MTAPGEREHGAEMRWDRFWAGHLFLHTHIAKTGGTTLTAALIDLAGGPCLDLRGRKLHVRDLDAGERDRLRVISGHVFHGLERHFERQVLYVAAVRDPVRREVSRYRFLQTQPDHPAHKAVAGRTFAEAWKALLAFRGEDQMRNGQCQQLTGRVLPHRLRRWEVQQRLRKDYFLVIPVDRLGEAIEALYRAFGRPVPEARRENVSIAPPVDVPPDLAGEIRSMNDLDDWMVGVAGRVFEERLVHAIAYLRTV